MSTSTPITGQILWQANSPAPQLAVVPRESDGVLVLAPNGNLNQNWVFVPATTATANPSLPLVGTLGLPIASGTYFIYYVDSETGEVGVLNTNLGGATFVVETYNPSNPKPELWHYDSTTKTIATGGNINNLDLLYWTPTLAPAVTGTVVTLSAGPIVPASQGHFVMNATASSGIVPGTGGNSVNGGGSGQVGGGSGLGGIAFMQSDKNKLNSAWAMSIAGLVLSVLSLIILIIMAGSLTYAARRIGRSRRGATIINDYWDDASLVASSSPLPQPIVTDTYSSSTVLNPLGSSVTTTTSDVELTTMSTL